MWAVMFHTDYKHNVNTRSYAHRAIRGVWRTLSVHHARHGLTTTRAGASIDVIRYDIKYTNKMKSKFSYFRKLKHITNHYLFGKLAAICRK